MCRSLCSFTGLFSHTSVNLVTHTPVVSDLQHCENHASFMALYIWNMCTSLKYVWNGSLHTFQICRNPHIFQICRQINKKMSLSWCYISEICVGLFVYLQVSFRIYWSMLSHTHLVPDLQHCGDHEYSMVLYSYNMCRSLCLFIRLLSHLRFSPTHICEKRPVNEQRDLHISAKRDL